MNYCKDNRLHVIKIMAKLHLREMRMSLLLVWKWQLFSGVSLYAGDDSRKFRN